MPKNRQTDGHMRAVLTSVIHQYPPERYLHFFFSSDLNYNNNRSDSKFYHVVCPPATVLPGENAIMKNGYAKNK